MKEIMTNKERLLKVFDEIGCEPINIIEATENTFIARFNNHACTETKIYYGFEEDGLNINYFGDVIPADEALILELIFEKSLDFLAVEQEYNGVKIKSTEFSPTFTRLMAEYQALSVEEQEAQEGRMLFANIMRNAPKSFNDMAFNMAKEMELVPDASGYLDNGDPVYSLEDVAEIHGISLEEALEVAKEMGVEPRLIDAEKINRVN